MREVILDGANWKSKDDIYDGFFRPVGAPTWHGRNLDALADGISGGSINQVEVPYRVIIKNYDKIAPHAKQMAESFVDLIGSWRERGARLRFAGKVNERHGLIRHSPWTGSVCSG